MIIMFTTVLNFSQFQCGFPDCSTVSKTHIMNLWVGKLWEELKNSLLAVRNLQTPTLKFRVLASMFALWIKKSTLEQNVHSFSELTTIATCVRVCLIGNCVSVCLIFRSSGLELLRPVLYFSLNGCIVTGKFVEVNSLVKFVIGIE